MDFVYCILHLQYVHHRTYDMTLSFSNINKWTSVHTVKKKMKCSENSEIQYTN